MDADRIPARDLTGWTVKYGYWGRNAFHTPKIVYGMNTAGLSVSALYLAGYTKYPVYNSADKRPVIGMFDLGNYLLSQARNVDEAADLVNSHQIVQFAIEIKPGIFLKNIPAHLIMRDKTGKSAVVEFIDGKVLVYASAGNVLTNSPTYPEQLENAKKYNKLDNKTKDGLTGLPGGFSSPDRFSRGYALLRNMPVSSSTQEALYQADFIISSMSTPYFGISGAGSNSNTIWKVVKDLDHNIIYTNNTVYFQGGGKIAPTHIVNGGYTIIDLNSIDFTAIPIEFLNNTIQPTSSDHVKKIITANELPEFGE